MGRKKVQTRCDPNTADSIEQYAENRNISESEAIRRLLRTGLHIQGMKVEDYDRIRQSEKAAQRRTLLLIAVVGVVGALAGAMLTMGVI